MTIAANNGSRHEQSSSGRRPVVAVRELCMTYAGRHGERPVHVLQRIDLEVYAGEFICLVGSSGCGKTTLLNLIAGFLKPTSGQIYVEGEPVRGPDPRRIFIFQEGGIFPWLDVAHNVAFGIAGRAVAERQHLVRHYVEMVGLSGFERAVPHELSGGMRQRVELARALASDPHVIYMDEPFGALDYFTRFKMRADLVRIWEQEKKTILFVTHDLDEAIQLATRIIVLTPRPATLLAAVPVELPRPRDLSSAAYSELRARLLRLLI